MRPASIGSKVLSTLGMLAIGDALAFAMSPAKHVRVWSFRREPPWYRKMMTSAATAPRGRAYGLAGLELVGGLGLAFAAERLASRHG